MNALKARRKELGWSQVMLSLKTGGIAPSDLSAIENGKKVPHPGWRKRIAKALKTDEASLFGGERKEERP
jgi:transcriptional regulator with XRE-family HTH domain